MPLKGECRQRFGGKRGSKCERDDGHGGPHVNYGVGVVWGGSPVMRVLVERPESYKLLEALVLLDFTDGEYRSVRVAHGEQPDVDPPDGRPRPRKRYG